MRFAWLVLLLGACTDGDVGVGPGDDRNGLQVQLTVEDDTEDVDIQSLGALVDEVVLEAEGPEGAVSLSVSADLEATLFGGVAGDRAVTLDLPAGEYRDVVIDVHLRESGGTHALWSTGWLRGQGEDDEDDDLPFDLEVRPDLVLTAEGSVELGEGPDPVVSLQLRPSKWFEDLDLEDHPVVLRLDPQSGENYERVVERIVDTTRSVFPGESGGED